MPHPPSATTNAQQPTPPTTETNSPMFTTSRLSGLMGAASLPSPPLPPRRMSGTAPDAFSDADEDAYSELDDLATLSGEPERKSESKSISTSQASSPLPSTSKPAGSKCSGPFALLRRHIRRSPPRCAGPSTSMSTRRDSSETLRSETFGIEAKAEPPSYAESADVQSTQKLEAASKSRSKSRSKSKQTRQEEERAYKDADPLALLMGRYGPGGGVPTPVLPSRSASKGSKSEEERYTKQSGRKSSPHARRQETEAQTQAQTHQDALTTLMARYGPGGGPVPTPAQGPAEGEARRTPPRSGSEE